MELKDTPELFQYEVNEAIRMYDAKLVSLTGSKGKQNAVLIDRVDIVYIIESIGSVGDYAPKISMVTMLKENLQAAIDSRKGVKK